MDNHDWLKICKKYFTCIIFAIFCNVLSAAEPVLSELELSAIAELSSVRLGKDEWHSVVKVNGSEEEYLLATKSGKIYTLNNGQINNSALLDLTVAFNKRDIITLTAIALDPSFNYRNRKGYRTFYTAHVEVNNQDNKAKFSTKLANLPKIDNIKNLPFDSVITRWQYNNSPEQLAKITMQHEVIRIPIPQKEDAIKQLSFSPYTEPWHEDFGLLYVLTAKSKANFLSQNPLYAGTVLRIKPERFGLQSYTVPVNNPFIKQPEIQNEIALLIGRDVMSFNWIKNGTYSLLIQLNGLDKNQLIQAKLGDDWREKSSTPLIKAKLASTKNNSNALLYYGRELKELWGKVLQLRATDNSWQLQALTLSSEEQSQTSPSFSIYNLLDTTKTARFSAHRSNDNELLLLDHNQQILFNIKTAKIVVNEKTKSNKVPVSTTKDDDNNNLMILIIIISLGLFTFAWYLRNNLGRKPHFLSQQWVNFDINKAKKSLTLYKRHHQTTEQVVEISSLKSSKILLNDEVISIISSDKDQAFSSAIEEQVLAAFAKEHRLKMIDEKQRKIQLHLTDNQDKEYSLCLYYRVGNIRQTKLKYSKVIDKVIDWHWLFAQYINADNTGKRRVKVKLKTEVTNSAAKKTNSSTILTQKTDNEQQTEITKSPRSKNKNIENPKTFETINNIGANQDTELVFALDKLVEMKKQGYLSEEEFNTAKTKILKDLADE
jgi:hypothetical protein